MYYGTSGECVEICGNGVNYGMKECDDGNTESGDGCSSVCTIESGWTCYGSSYTTKDTCYKVLTQISSVSVTSDNNLILEFTNDIMILGELTEDDFQVVIYEFNNGRSLNINFTKIQWSIPDSIYAMMPSRILYMQLN